MPEPERKTVTIPFPLSKIGMALFLVFLVLRLTGVITWSWWWVTAPLWIPACLFFVLFGIGMVIVAILAATKR